ncbi:restriction endonuclease subunit S [Pseudomonas paraeruginosa]|uniref:restriction endonuclease subunit S n=1 Tax=Pseudomonas paraeruginosa TaxID=2994495 RepID=UPI0039FD9D5F
MSYYKPYPAYKDSGVDWLGPVPDHWQVVRMRYAATLNPPVRSDLLGDPDQEVSFLPMEAIGEDGSLSLEQVRPVADVRNGYSYFEDGDVAFAKVTPCFENGKGALMRGLQCAAGFGTTELTVLRPKPAAADARYINYIVQGSSFRAFGAGAMTGAGGLKRVPDEFTRNFPVPLPELGEQRLIAAHLDSETARIDALIEKKTRFIELLREKRQALITHAVTKGLDPNVKMKDSGVEWLGDVPEHWVVKRLKFIATVQTGIAKGKDNAEKDTVEVPYLRVANVQDGYLDLDEVATIEVSTADLPRYLLQSGDVLMNEGGDFDKLGRGHVWHGEIEPCIHQNHVFAVRPHGVSSEWLNTFTSSAAAQFYFMGRSKQSTNLASISSSNLMELAVPLPCEEEQRLILDELDRQTAKVNALGAKIERSIALLKERRSALITAAVTGQIDLREAV